MWAESWLLVIFQQQIFFHKSPTPLWMWLEGVRMASISRRGHTTAHRAKQGKNCCLLCSSVSAVFFIYCIANFDSGHCDIPVLFSCKQIPPGQAPAGMVTDEVDLNFCLQTAFSCRLRLTAYDSFVGPRAVRPYTSAYTAAKTASVPAVQRANMPTSCRPNSSRMRQSMGKGRQNVRPPSAGAGRTPAGSVPVGGAHLPAAHAYLLHDLIAALILIALRRPVCSR